MPAKQKKAGKKGLFIALGAAALVAVVAVCGILFLPKIIPGLYQVNHPHAIDAEPVSGKPTSIDYIDEQGVSYMFYNDGTAAAVMLDQKNYPQNLVIPSKVEGYTVTEIGFSARITATNGRLFAGRIGGGYADLERVKLPDTVVRIGYGSFYGCKNLREVVIPSSVQFIGPLAFGDTPWLESQTDEFVMAGDHVLIRYNGPQKEKVTVPEGVRSLGGAFTWDRDEALEEVVLPGSLRIIGEWAFAGNTALQPLEIKLPEGLLFIDYGALKVSAPQFSTERRLPNSLKEISTCVFGEDTYMVVWPKDLDTIWADDMSSVQSEAQNIPLMHYVLPYSTIDYLDKMSAAQGKKPSAIPDFIVYVDKGSQGEKWMKEYEQWADEQGKVICWEYSTDAPPKR